MAFPEGVTTCTLTFGSAVQYDGSTDIETIITVTPTHALVWGATGQPVLAVPFTRTAAAGAPGSVEVPHVDQAGFVSSTGAAFTMWAYTVKMEWTLNGRLVANTSKSVQPLSGQDVVDLDLVPSGPITTPVSAPLPSVLSVNGETGNVVIEAGGGGVESWAEVVAVEDFPAAGLVEGDDARLGDERTPLDDSVTDVKIPTDAAINLAKTVDSADGDGRYAMTAAQVSKLAGMPADAPSVAESEIIATDIANARISATVPGLIAGKAEDSAVVHDTGDETIGGTKTFSAAPVVPDASFTAAKVTGLTAALDAKAPLASPTFTGTVSGVSKTHVGLGSVDDVRQVPLAGQRLRIAATAADTWPSRAASLPSGFTGPAVWDHSEYGTVTTLPSDLAAGDWVEDLAP